MVSETGEFHKGVEIDFLNSGGWEPRSVSWHLEGANPGFPQEEEGYPTSPSFPTQEHLSIKAWRDGSVLKSRVSLF